MTEVSDQKAQLQAELKKRNIKFHHFAGEAKLRELLSEAVLKEATGGVPDEPAAPQSPVMARRSRRNTERAERQRRGRNDASHQMKLSVGFDLDPDFEYRWINGGLDQQRLHDLSRPDTQGGDWMPVNASGHAVNEESDSTGTVLRRAVGLNQAGETEYAYLCRKPKDIFEEDFAAKQALNDKRMQAIQDGTNEDQRVQNDAPEGFRPDLQVTGLGRNAIKV